MKVLIQTLFLSLFLSQVACSEEATSPISPLDPSSERSSTYTDEEHEHLELVALKYEGIDAFDNPCTLYVAGLEEGEEEHDRNSRHEGEHEEHDFQVIAKLDYKVHGLTPIDSIFEFKLYDSADKTYLPIDATQSGTKPVMISALLKNEEAEVDYNKLAVYEQDGSLVQLLRADLFDVDVESFKDSMFEVFEDQNNYGEFKNSLDQLRRTVLKIQHLGHYDSALCSDFELRGMEGVAFNLDGHDDHEEGDHGHGHGHDHDHDHD